MKIPGQQRKAISPIVATVLIIAATLIAAAAILGYVFGIFGGASNTANLSVTSAPLSHSVSSQATNSTVSLYSYCPASKTCGAFVVANTGSAAGTVTGVQVTYGSSIGSLTSSGAKTYAFSVPAGGSLTLYVTNLGTGAAATLSAGNSFNGYFSTSNGAQVSFTGTFS